MCSQHPKGAQLIFDPCNLLHGSIHCLDAGFSRGDFRLGYRSSASGVNQPANVRAVAGSSAGCERCLPADRRLAVCSLESPVHPPKQLGGEVRGRFGAVGDASDEKVNCASAVPIFPGSWSRDSIDRLQSDLNHHQSPGRLYISPPVRRLRIIRDTSPSSCRSIPTILRSDLPRSNRFRLNPAPGPEPAETESTR